MSAVRSRSEYSRKNAQSITEVNGLRCCRGWHSGLEDLAVNGRTRDRAPTVLHILQRMSQCAEGAGLSHLLSPRVDRRT